MVIICTRKTVNKCNIPIKCSYVQWSLKLVEIKLTSWFRFKLKKCAMFLYMDEKRMPFMNFTKVNAKNLDGV